MLGILYQKEEQLKLKFYHHQLKKGIYVKFLVKYQFNLRFLKDSYIVQFRSFNRIQNSLLDNYLSLKDVGEILVFLSQTLFNRNTPPSQLIMIPNQNKTMYRDLRRYMVNLLVKLPYLWNLFQSLIAQRRLVYLFNIQLNCPFKRCNQRRYLVRNKGCN